MSTLQFQNAAVKADYDILTARTSVTVRKPNQLVLHNFAYPEGWTPRTTDLLVRYTTDYPHTQPAIYIPSELEYDGRVRHFWHDDGSALTASGEWIRWCTHYIDWQVWRASARRAGKHPLLRFLGLIRDSLKFPHKSNPIEHVSRHD